jgi:hypothetical protein
MKEAQMSNFYGAFYGADEFRNKLKELGFAIAYDHFAHSPTIINWTAYKRLPSTNECVCNEKPPSLVIKVDGYKSTTYEIEVCGETPGSWVKLLAYSLDVLDFDKDFSKHEAYLLKAWDSAF